MVKVIAVASLATVLPLTLACHVRLIFLKIIPILKIKRFIARFHLFQLIKASSEHVSFFFSYNRNEDYLSKAYTYRYAITMLVKQDEN